MNWADWGIIAIIVLSGLISLKRGFIKEALSLLIWVLAFVIARMFSANMATLLVDYIDVPTIRYVAAFAILFAATLMVGALVNYLISTLVRITGLSGTDRVLGIIFGLGRGALLVVVAVALVKHTPLTDAMWWAQSALIPEFLMLEEWSFELFGKIARAIMGAAE
ncbi:Colicin V production protein [gamma proteobacterium IMCC2047]|nr:Colicin V production protein [gamma proteobacterium IMCC2047]